MFLVRDLMFSEPNYKLKTLSVDSDIGISKRFAGLML